MRFFDFTLKQTKDYQSVTEHPRASVNFQSVPTSSAEEFNMAGLGAFLYLAASF